MIVERRSPVAEAIEELGAISSCIGLTEQEVITLMLCSGLTISDILDHIEAVTANRIH
ncbi:MAG: hypothetical protein WB952_03650 [Terriglobales bacterium]